MKLFLDLGRDISVDDILRFEPGSLIDISRCKQFAVRVDDGRLLATVEPVVEEGRLIALRAKVVSTSVKHRERVFAREREEANEYADLYPPRALPDSTEYPEY